MLNLNLTTGGHGAFKIRVRLDDAWKGKEIAVLDIPADAPKAAMMYQVAVPDVEGLTGKHAIYLVADGPEVKAPERPRWGGPRGPQRPQGLFDLHGIGFSKAGEVLEAPQVPQVTITIDGQALVIPQNPIWFTNLNGYAEANQDGSRDGSLTHFQASWVCSSESKAKYFLTIFFCNSIF